MQVHHRTCVVAVISLSIWMNIERDKLFWLMDGECCQLSLAMDIFNDWKQFENQTSECAFYATIKG